MKKRLFSGIQPSGDVHIGNYLGAIRNWVRMIDQYDCIFCIVDYHAITIEYNPEDMQKRILNAAAVNIAAGLDPNRCIIFVQSYVPEHTELAWILNTVTPMGHLERMTQFKDKSKQHRENINAGLFTYPVLQAADILLYKGEAVPVGEDQVQHIELCREIARKFNMRYGETFPDPMEILSEAPRIMGLDGKTKMSKSLGNYISLVESPESIWKKLSTAVTDENRKRRTDPGNPDICNLFTLHKYFSKHEQIEQINRVCRTAEIGCIECKKILSENIVRVLTPIRTAYERLINDREYLSDVLHAGAKKCRKIAEETMSEVKKKMGLL
jgi:tryptophanyl-tRNA synthetase